jgi:cation transporter-like permease
VYFQLRLHIGITVSAAVSDSHPQYYHHHHHPQQHPSTRIIPAMRSTNKDNNDNSNVLSELKETIRQQAAVIDTLQRQLKGVDTDTPKTTKERFTVPTNLHGGGGGGSTSHMAIDEMTQYIHRPFYYIASQRVGWLGLFMVSLSFTAIIMSEFEHILAKEVELAFFVPFLAGHGGNTGGQAVGTVLSALSAGVVTIHDAPKVIIKEAMSGLSMGIVLGSIVAPLAHYGMGISPHVATVIWCTLPLVSTIAATLGSTIPFACLALGLNPSVIAAPAMTSLVDVSGLLSYFVIASRVFGMFGIKLK